MLNALMDRWGYRFLHAVQIKYFCSILWSTTLIMGRFGSQLNVRTLFKYLLFLQSLQSVNIYIFIACSHFLFIYSRANIWSLLSCHTLSIKKTLPSKFYLSMEAGKSDVVAATVVRSKLVFLSNGRLDRYLTVWHSDQL